MALALAGCGFKLRRPLPLSFNSAALAGFAPRSPLAEELRRSLTDANVRVLDSPDRVEVVIQALTDAREKAVVASTAAAQVRELQLRLRVHLRARTPGGRELMPAVELLLTRDLSTSEAAALGKAQEEDQLYRDMQLDVVQQVMRRLAAIRL